MWCRRGKTTSKDSPGAERSGQPAQFSTLLSIEFHDVSTVSETKNGANKITSIFLGSVLIVGVFGFYANYRRFDAFFHTCMMLD